jgi:hypothetical protein
MCRDNPAGCDRGIVSPSRPILELPTYIRGCARIALAIALLACPGLKALGAATDDTPLGLTVHRSTRAIPHRFIVHPDGAIVATNQTQRFAVTDSEGRAVAVHWNVSGIGCSGAGCGTVDDQGVYRTPSTLPQGRVVTLEAVLDSNPNYSVLTQVRLTAAAAAETPVSAQVPKEKIQAITAPVVGRQSVASRTELPPLPGAVDAAPMLAKQTVASGAGLPPLPVAVNAAPVVAQQTVARSTGFTPAPNVVSAPPAVAQQTVARSTGFTPAPNVVSAPPAVAPQTVARSTEFTPVPNVISAPPAVAPLTAARSTDFTPVPNVVSAPPAAKTKKADRSGESISLGLVVGGAPVVTRGTIASSAQLPPLPGAVAAAPVVASKTVSISTELPALPRAVAAAPVVAKQNDVISRVVLPPMPGAVASLTPTSGRVFAGKTQQVTSPVDAKANTGVGAALLPMADAVAAAPTGTTGAGQHAPTVTYRDGQLTIDVENLTLAAVLKLIAEKIGAVIDVPPGSGQERIFEHAGPGRADDVLAQLLNGSHFNFIMVNSPQDPNAVAQVLLSVEQQGASPAAAPETEALAARMPEPVPSPNVNQKPAEGDTTLQPLPPPADVKPPAPENMSPDQRGEYMRSLFKKLTNQSSEQGSQTPPPAPPQ